jgi:serine/threonine protein kinase
MPYRFSPELKDLIQRMLAVNLRNRISINELLEHIFCHLYDESAFDTFEPIIAPEISLTQDIQHISAAIWRMKIEKTRLHFFL